MLLLERDWWGTSLLVGLICSPPVVALPSVGVPPDENFAALPIVALPPVAPVSVLPVDVEEGSLSVGGLGSGSLPKAATMMGRKRD